MGHGRVNMLLKHGRIITLLGVLHILDLSRSIICVIKLNDVGVHTLLGKGTCKMVQGAMVLMRGVRCRTLYMLFGTTYMMGVIVLFSLSIEIKKIRSILALEIRPYCGIKYWDILEKRAFKHYMVNVWLKVCLIAPWILISVNMECLVKK
jgi:hypothetical protein